MDSVNGGKRRDVDDLPTKTCDVTVLKKRGVQGSTPGASTMFARIGRGCLSGTASRCRLDVDAWRSGDGLDALDGLVLLPAIGVVNEELVEPQEDRARHFVRVVLPT